MSAGIVAIAAGNYHTCCLLTSESVYCWGLNHVGELGTGDTSNRLTPTAVTGLGAGERNDIFIYIYIDIFHSPSLPRGRPSR